ncbi:MAG: hypothetical protein ACI9LM_003303 [Alteromonadaceae bacterium]|jgi:hypothetical protein
MEYKKEVIIEGKEFVFSLTEKREFMFYTFNDKYNPMDVWGEVNRSFNNLRGKLNPFSIFIEIQKYIKYLFSCGVTYFYFSCEDERFEIYEFFIARLVKNSGYYTTIHKEKNEFYVYKCS